MKYSLHEPAPMRFLEFGTNEEIIALKVDSHELYSLAFDSEAGWVFIVRSAGQVEPAPKDRPTCLHCEQAIRVDPERGWVHLEGDSALCSGSTTAEPRRTRSTT